METECAAGDGLCALSIYAARGPVCERTHTHAAPLGGGEWLAVGADLYFPSLLSILWDQLCHGKTGRGFITVYDSR